MDGSLEVLAELMGHGPLRAQSWESKQTGEDVNADTEVGVFGVKQGMCIFVCKKKVENKLLLPLFAMSSVKASLFMVCSTYSSNTCQK